MEESKNEQENIKNDKELLRIKKKYSIKYVLIVKLIEIYIIFFLVIFASFYSGLIAAGILSIFTLLVITVITLILSKKSALQTYLLFYEDRVVYKRKFLFLNEEKVIKYSDIKDIVFTHGTNWYTRMWQKIFKYGDIYIYPKKGNILTHGIILEVVENINKVIEDIKMIVGDKIK